MIACTSITRQRAKLTSVTTITPVAVEIQDTGKGKKSVAEDLEAVRRKIEYWHQGSIARYRISYRSTQGTEHFVE